MWSKIWTKIKQFFAIVWAIIKKIIVWIEDGITDIAGKLDIRVIFSIGLFVGIMFLVFKLPGVIALGKTFDLIGYGAVISIIAGTMLTLMGFAKSSLDATKGPGGPVSSIVGEVKDAIDKIVKV